jgi:protein-S-isoprenylcysteine O-methyltransferase Ste14
MLGVATPEKIMVEARREKKITFRQLAQRIRVPSGFVIAPLLIITARPTKTTLLAGAAIAAAGLLIRAFASGFLRKNMELATAGPYAHTRNPLYLGTLLLGTGIAISGGTWWFVILFIGLYLFIYLPVMRAEADTLRQLFPDEYEHYRRSVPLLLPRLTPYRAPASIDSAGTEAKAPRAGRFDLGQYLRHREYRATIGALAVYALLVARMLLEL